MVLWLLHGMVVGGTALCLLYYVFAIYSSRRFFSRSAGPGVFTPPASILKPVSGLDPEAMANFASFCRQDYPDYEILFGVTAPDDPAVPVIQKLLEEFPERPMRLVIGTDAKGANEKVSKLCRLEREAHYEVLVISDSDMRVAPDYLRAVVAPLSNQQVGAATCVYRAFAPPRLGSELDAIGLSTDFFAGVVTAWQLEGVKFTLGGTVATTRRHLAEMGGLEAIADCLFDDFELGRRIACKGFRVELLPYVVSTLLPSESLADFFKRHLRWSVGLRHSRPWGHLGLALTQGLPWSLAAMALEHSRVMMAAYLGAYLLFRYAMAWTVGVRGLQDPLLMRKPWLVPLRDAIGFLIWLISFGSNRIEWRGNKFVVRGGRLIPIPSGAETKASSQDATVERYGV